MMLIGGIAAAHLIAVAAALRARPSSRRQLALVFAAAVPVAGPALAALALIVRGQGEPRLEEPEIELWRRPPTPEEIERMTMSPAALERICAGDAERRAVMAALARRDDPEAVELLRWTIERRRGEAAVDAALTLEDLTRRHEERLDGARVRVAADDGAEAALAVADAAAAFVHNGIADPPLVPVYAAEAREHYELAIARGAAPASLAARRARLELAAMCPDAALALLVDVEASDPAEAERLEALRADAAFAARRGDAEQAARGATEDTAGAA